MLVKVYVKAYASANRRLIVSRRQAQDRQIAGNPLEPFDTALPLKNR